jgi:hypothetical protein
MNSSGKKSPRGAKLPKGDEPEMTDEQLRDLIAAVDDKPFLTKEEEDAAVARLKPAIDEHLKRAASKARGRNPPEGKGEMEMTDEQLRELLAPLREAHLPTPDERKEIVARLKPVIEECVRRESEITDEQIRDLIAQVEDAPFLTKEREDAVLARLSETFKKRGIRFPSLKR